MKELSVMIEKAIEAHACEGEIKKIKGFKNLDDLIENATDEQKAEWACWYALHIIGGRWPEVEQYIEKDPQWAYVYTENVIQDRWPEAESTIMKSAYSAFHYALQVIEDKWPEAESIIMKHPNWIFHYAFNVIKDKWLEAESVIKKDECSWEAYCKVFNIEE